MLPMNSGVKIVSSTPLTLQDFVSIYPKEIIGFSKEHPFSADVFCTILHLTDQNFKMAKLCREKGLSTVHSLSSSC